MAKNSFVCSLYNLICIKFTHTTAKYCNLKKLHWNLAQANSVDKEIYRSYLIDYQTIRDKGSEAPLSAKSKALL